MQTRASSSRQVVAEVQRDAAGQPRAFTLSLDRERIVLDPVTSWGKADTFKWVTRGLIEQPQSFHVYPDGTVEINGEKISPHDADGTARLEHEINKHHELPTGPKLAADLTPQKLAAQRHASDRVEFRAKLDHFGHLQIECFAGEERTVTGLRGLPSLMQNGLMLKPAAFHVDPMQRHVEIDGVRFECNDAGVRSLEAALNARYAPKLKDPGETPVEIRENPASPSGFDVRFVTVHAGARFEIKGHLDQEKLDILQDPAKCNLLKPGILFRLVPPFLLVRRRRPDGGEERVPELRDLEYLRATPVELQQLFNHPLVRRGAAGGALATATAARPVEADREVIGWRVRRNPQNKLVLWIEGVGRGGEVVEGRALTHHNVAELQHSGRFRPHLDVTLSLDNRTLSVLDKATGKEERLVVEPNSPDSDFERAAEMLTVALRPPEPRTDDGASGPATPPILESAEGARPAPEDRPIEPSQCAGPGTTAAPPPSGPEAPEVVPPRGEMTPGRDEAAEPGAPRSSDAPPASATVSSRAVAEGPEPALPARAVPFPMTDPIETIVSVFRALAARSGLPVHDVLLSLPPAFTDRRFEVLAFDGRPVEGVLELRADAFAGFYLTHLRADNVLLVYANSGRHIEFGPGRCELQATTAAEPDEFRDSGLLGLAQDGEGNFVFLVTPEYRSWVAARENPYVEAGARFLTAADAANARAELMLIWPPRWETPSRVRQDSDGREGGLTPRA